MTSSRIDQLAQVAEAVNNLSESPLFDYRKNHHYQPVPGEGDPHARVMFIGEAPGRQEAKTGRPFVGAAGRILDELLDSIGMNRENVFITNIVKDRPPENRDPTEEEINLYAPFLQHQIEIIQPEVIATLGRFAMNYILKKFDLPQQGKKISELHGKSIAAQASYGPVQILPLYHPAVALYRRDRKDVLLEDIKTLQKTV